MIIDIHVHSMPRAGVDVLPRVVRQCRMNGVSLALVSSIGRHSHFPDEDEVRGANEEARDFAGRSEGLCRWLAYINPQNANWRDELDRCAEGGAVGLKLWTALKDADGRLDRTEAVIRCAGEKRLPLLIHTFQRTSANDPGEITLVELATLAERCPDAMLVGAHGGANWNLSMGILRDRAPNAHVDLSGSYPEKGMLEVLVRDIGAARILFGSDLVGRTLASQLAKVVFADIAEEEKELILWRNTARVFNVEPVPSSVSAPLRPTQELPDFRTEHFCFCGRWPFFGAPSVTPMQLDALLAEAGIEKAYTGDLDGLYELDLESANNRFLEAARDAPRVAPLATLNPRAHNWRSVVRYLRDGFAGAIVYPYLHNWRLDGPEHAEFFRLLAQKRVPVWINCIVADDRFRHSGLACRAVATEEAIAFCAGAPPNAYVFQGLSGRGVAQILARCRGDERFRFEISRLTDNSGALDDVVGEYGLSRLVMGSEFPLRDLREVRWTAQRI